MRIFTINRPVTLELTDVATGEATTEPVSQTFRVAVNGEALHFVKNDGSFGAQLATLDAAQVKRLS